MLIRLLTPLMVDGIDHPAGDLVNAPDQVAQEWITQRLAEPAVPERSPDRSPPPIQTATPPHPPAAVAPAQRRPRSPRSPRSRPVS